MDIKSMSHEELLKLAKEKGVELTDEQLTKISAAGVWEGEVTGYEITCGYCGGTFETNVPEPQYCQLCGTKMYW